MKNVTMIAAVGKNLELGKDNKLLWHLPEDLKFFKEQTMGKPIVMGKRTLDSLPRLLPGRLHLVLTHQEIEPNEQIKVFRSIDSLVDFISTLDQEVMVIGGAQVYKEMLDLYATLSFYNADGTYNQKTIVEYTTEALCDHGLKNTNQIQECANIWIYPKEYFCPMDFYTKKIVFTDRTYTIHHYTASWVSNTFKIRRMVSLYLGKNIGDILSRIYQLCRKFYYVIFY